MALLDVSEVLNDPLFQEPAVLIRRREAIGDDGVTVLTEGAKPIMVVATSGDGDLLAQTPTGRTLNSTVRFYTSEGISPGQSEQSADVVLWRGRRYVAISVSDWTNWGAGFTSASCQLLDFDGGTPDDDPATGTGTSGQGAGSGFLPAGRVTHRQAEPAAVWIIRHALPGRPEIEVYDDGGTVVEGHPPLFPDANTVVLRFSRPLSGTAYLT